MKRVALASAVSLALVSSAARADDCPQIRPTDPAGYSGYAYDVTATSFSSPEGNVKVWYTTSGKHAPSLSTTRTDLVPDSVVTVANVLEDAIVKYRKLGFKDAIRDGDYPSCASNGGDDRIDIYLVSFVGADGLTATERCTTASPTVRCPGFMLVDKNFAARGYPTQLEGAQTVVPHEYFHMIQNAYDSQMDRFWAEGSAQWGAKQVNPGIMDLERFLPEFFSQTDRPIDAPAGGVTAGFLYASAIWPVFLAERQGQGIVLDILTAEAAVKGTPLEAAATVLAGKKTTLADEFVLFTTWNAATGKRAGTGGYAKASSYPLVNLIDFPDGVPAQVDAVTAGFSARYYFAQDPTPRMVTLTADATRLGGVALPLESGKARVDLAKPLPTVITGETILVLGGRSSKKTDVPFTLSADAPAVDAGPDVGDDAAPPAATPSDSKSGCSCTTPAHDASNASWASFAGLALVCLLRARRR